MCGGEHPKNIAANMKNLRNMDIKLVLSVLAFVAAIVMAFIGLIAPPKGNIDGSVNMLVAQLLVFVSTLLGIDSYTTTFRDLRVGSRRTNISKT